MRSKLLWIIVLVAIPRIMYAQLYELIEDPGFSRIRLDQGQYKMHGVSCESEAISKGTYRLDRDTLKLFPYAGRDSILPLAVFQFTPGNDSVVTIKVVEESGRPWQGFNVTSGNSDREFYDLYTDATGACTYKDTSHRYLVLSYLNNSLDFSDEANHRYFWDSKTKGAYLVTIPDDGFFVLDRNIIIVDEPVFYLSSGKYLYRLDEPTRPVYRIKEIK